MTKFLSLDGGSDGAQKKSETHGELLINDDRILWEKFWYLIRGGDSLTLERLNGFVFFPLTLCLPSGRWSGITGSARLYASPDFPSVCHSLVPVAFVIIKRQRREVGEEEKK